MKKQILFFSIITSAGFIQAIDSLPPLPYAEKFDKQFQSYKLVKAKQRLTKNQYIWGDTLEVKEYETGYELLVNGENLRKLILQYSRFNLISNRELNKKELKIGNNVNFKSFGKHISLEFKKIHDINEKISKTDYYNSEMARLAKAYYHSYKALLKIYTATDKNALEPDVIAELAKSLLYTAKKHRGVKDSFCTVTTDAHGKYEYSPNHLVDNYFQSFFIAKPSMEKRSRSPIIFADAYIIYPHNYGYTPVIKYSDQGVKNLIWKLEGFRPALISANGEEMGDIYDTAAKNFVSAYIKKDTYKNSKFFRKEIAYTVSSLARIYQSLGHLYISTNLNDRQKATYYIALIDATKQYKIRLKDNYRTFGVNETDQTELFLDVFPEKIAKEGKSSGEEIGSVPTQRITPRLKEAESSLENGERYSEKQAHEPKLIEQSQNPLERKELTLTQQEPQDKIEQNEFNQAEFSKISKKRPIKSSILEEDSITIVQKPKLFFTNN